MQEPHPDRPHIILALEGLNRQCRARHDVAGVRENGDSEDSGTLLAELDAFFTDHRLSRSQT
jgi:hypothetical protein